MSANSNFDQWHNWGENKEPRPKRKKYGMLKLKMSTSKKGAF
ncbi:hypothetical protein SDC49_13155 [Lactobacillus sp. R2/2]|nr:hypothetical protein [Lactobacillus sp. R2/2]